MNIEPSAILALLSEQVLRIAQLTQENEQLRQALADQEQAQDAIA